MGDTNHLRTGMILQAVTTRYKMPNLARSARTSRRRKFQGERSKKPKKDFAFRRAQRNQRTAMPKLNFLRISRHDRIYHPYRHAHQPSLHQTQPSLHQTQTRHPHFGPHLVVPLLVCVFRQVFWPSTSRPGFLPAPCWPQLTNAAFKVSLVRF